MHGLGQRFSGDARLTNEGGHLSLHQVHGRSRCRCPGGTDGGCRADQQPNAPLRSGSRRHRQLRPFEAPRVRGDHPLHEQRGIDRSKPHGHIDTPGEAPAHTASGGAAAPQIACCREVVGHDWAGDDWGGTQDRKPEWNAPRGTCRGRTRALGRRLADRDELWGGKARGVAADAGIARPDACSASRRPAPLRCG